MGTDAGNNTTGNNNIAIGTGAGNGVANNSTAIGTGAQANANGSTALGAGAVANLPNQFVMGTSQDTYQAPGITSSLSRSRQSGPLEVVTSDGQWELGH